MAGSYGAIREYRDDPDFRDSRDEEPGSSVAELTERIRSNIYKVNNGANAVDRAMKSIGTDRDSSQLRDKIHETSQATGKVVQETTRLLRAAATKKADKVQFDTDFLTDGENSKSVAFSCNVHISVGTVESLQIESG
ncbi:syntaxin-12 [Elysia marginata]|uniref:Syntaxin-12 n=1 Tax=Elysia marginata TaxID=1093978 RepID=A0AAV4GN51_9GAST|nr:syntaxin-12 [Elysia marginata]